jgi:FkbM family methyltransferase
MEASPSLRSLLADCHSRQKLLLELHTDRQLADALLEMLLHLQGYNNPQNSRFSGEAFFVAVVLAQLGVRDCLDVGAAQGQYSRLLLNTLPESRVTAFEPLPLNRPILEAMQQRDPQRFKLFPFALGAAAAEATLHYEIARPQLATFCQGLEAIDYLANDQQVRVPIRRLDDCWLPALNRPPIEFIKIDSEGWEAEILDGAAATLRQSRPVAIQLEFNRHHLFRGHTFLSLASRLPGYGVFQLLPDCLVRRDPAAPLTNLFQFSNFAFIREDQIATVLPFSR